MNDTKEKYNIGDVLFDQYKIIAFKGMKSGAKVYDVQCIKCGYIYYNQLISTIKKRVFIRKVPCDNHGGTVGKSGYIAYKWKNPKARFIYLGMMARCYNTNNKDYSIYGERGIRVCDEWKNDRSTFDEWCTKTGYKPGLTIGRKDPNGNYCPENCEWQTRNYNSGHQKRNLEEYIVIDFENNTSRTMNLAEISRSFGLSPDNLGKIRKYEGYQALSNKFDELSEQGFINNGDASLYKPNSITKYTVIDLENNTSEITTLNKISQYYGYTSTYLAGIKHYKGEEAFLNKMIKLSELDHSSIKHRTNDNTKYTIVDLENGIKEVLAQSQLSLRLHHAQNWIANLKYKYGEERAAHDIVECLEKEE